MSVNEAKSIEINETDCDNPISLDEIEKGLWLGWFLQLFFFWSFFSFFICMTQSFIYDEEKIIEILYFCLFSGSFTAAADIHTLKSRSITHILTLDICPLPVRITELPFLKTKFIHGKSPTLVLNSIMHPLSLIIRLSIINFCCFFEIFVVNSVRYSKR